MPFLGRKFYFLRTNSRGEQRSVAARQGFAGRPVSVDGSGLGVRGVVFADIATEANTVAAQNRKKIDRQGER